MTDLIEFLISEEAIMVYIVALILSVFYIIFYFIKKGSNNRKLKHNTMELKRLSEEVMDLAVKQETKVVLDEKPVLMAVESKKEELPKANTVMEEPKKVAPFKTAPVVETKPVVEPIKVTPAVEVKPVVEPAKVTPAVEVKPVVEPIKAAPIIEAKPVVAEPVQEIVEDAIEEVVEEPVIEEKSVESNLVYTAIEPKQEEAIRELEEMTEKLENNENPIENIELTEFERMQEDTAIISLDELMMKAKEMYGNSEVIEEDRGDEPITLAEFEARRNHSVDTKQEEATVTIDDVLGVKITEVKEETKKFKSSPVISPVYGIASNDKVINKNTDLELENTANYEKLDEEIRKTNDFISTLKELQSNLD